jgi:SAM-dependent methyltransferase
MGALGGMMAQQATAWDAIFRERGRVFTHPQEDMPALADALRGATTVLDLGCGTGRHVVYFAERGFAVSGLDSSPEGLRLTADALRVAGRTADLRLGDMYAPLPYADAAFDAVVAVQVIHHARLAAIRQLVAELHRVLKPGGVVFASVPKLRNQATQFREIEPGTYLPLDGREAGLPHRFFTPEELRAVFHQFVVDDMHLDGTNHYCLLGHKPAS